MKAHNRRRAGHDREDQRAAPHSGDAQAAFDDSPGEVQMRIYRMSFVAGLAIGFVAGTRAGREKYEQMVKLARQTADNPSVQQAAGAMQAQATELLSAATKAMHDKAPQLAHVLEDHIPALRHKNGHDGSSSYSGSESGTDRPFATTSDSSAGSARPGSPRPPR
jgi:hypothetical protein